MSEVDIELHFEPPCKEWIDALSGSDVIKQGLPDYWWHSFESVGGGLFLQLKDMNIGAGWPVLEKWQSEDGRLHLDLFAGSQGYEFIRAMVQLLHQAGCQKVEAMVYHNECEVIVDDEGVTHPIGTRYYIDNSSCLAEEDYPEIEYEYE